MLNKYQPSGTGGTRLPSVVVFGDKQMHKEVIFILKEKKGKSCSLVTNLDLGLDMFKTVLTSHFFCYLVRPQKTQEL